ncbi:hypothetical protein SAMN04489712_102580 [Thermomonospora echinospora]|uniref:Uncharacterized protein n=1 Tax=Thermomonospora echinospora TaxID=1992 RepID=A0A1H5W406_9ACTN|nr:hypothetical protein [Thermomonospora echinospora]SEF94215.1 hypothetical protein SAMN04489712_102580 [Thermomonospora echinospora]
MTDQLLKEAFQRIADRAQPVQGLAEKAMGRASRRRASRLSAAAAVAVAGAVAAPFVLFGGQPATDPANDRGSLGFPVNTPSERALARECATGGTVPNRPEPYYGKPDDYRLLTSVRAEGETVALVGTRHHFMLCLSQAGGHTEVPLPGAWMGDTAGGLWSFEGAARIDAIQYMARTGGDPVPREFRHVVVGRVKEDVARVVVTWDGGRQVDAAVRNGFFLARIDGMAVKITDRRELEDRGFGDLRELREPGDDRVRSVRAFDKQGNDVFLFHTGDGAGVRRFSSTDCPKGTKGPVNALCVGLPKRS